MNAHFLLGFLSFFVVSSPKTLIDFEKKGEINKWQVVDDGVMGGLSQGSLHLSSEGNAIFEGDVSTANNGGFSSIRSSFSAQELKDFSSFTLRIKGDGKKYQFRVKENAKDYFSYIIEFQTSGEWETIELPFALLYPSFRGQRLNKSNFSGIQLEEVAFLVGNKKTEHFRIEIAQIGMK